MDAMMTVERKQGQLDGVALEYHRLWAGCPRDIYIYIRIYIPKQKPLVITLA